MENITFKGREMSTEDFLKMFLTNVPAAKIKMSIADLKKFGTEDIFGDKDLEAFQKIETAADLNDFILSPTTQNIGAKELLKDCLEDKKISFNRRALISFGKKHVQIIFESLFDFGDVKEIQPPQPVQIAQPGQPAPQSAPTPEPVKIELSQERMQNILNGCREFIRRDDVDVTQFELTENMPVTLLNEFYMMIPANFQIYYGAAAVVTQDRSHEVAGGGSLRLHEGETHILLEERNIDYNLFREQNSFDIVLFPQKAQEFFERGEDYRDEVYLAQCIIDLKQPALAQSTLCIDFGTSNTTVGTYGIKNFDTNEPEIVDFLDETGETPERKKMLPTIVYIESLSGKRVKYLFGYEALKKVIDKDYNPTASVFYEIKRWVNNIDDLETVTDEQGRKAELSHKEIIRAYIEHVLNLAEQHFERRFAKLHFTAPVKLKDSFIEEMRKMFDGKNRNVNDASHSIDEGIAIIYNHVAEQIKKGNADKPEKVLIMDCGGGTTDLASCQYSLNTTGYSKDLNIVTRFENGDSNFGGNNITFRILQLLKIKLAHKLQGKEFSVQKVIADENKILRKIDLNHENSDSEQDDRKLIYSEFDAEYEKAENFVPTKFGAEKLLQKKSKLKRNFYYLWQMAEAYKIQFYRANMDFVSVDFNNPDDRKIGIPDDDKYYLYVKGTSGELEKLTNPMSGIEVTNNDIHRLLYADIYALLKTVLYSYDANDNEQELLKYNYYKLSGQSCKITLFNELLKEFIPGKYLRYGDEKISSPDSIELKLACIKGSIYYIRDTEYGEIKPKITMENPQLIYDVCKVDVDGKNKKIMLERGTTPLRPTVDKISSEARRVRYIVEDGSGKRQNVVDFQIEKNVGRPITTTELKISIGNLTFDANGAMGGHIVRELTDIDLSKERDKKVFALFVIPSKTGYGFYVYCLRVEDGAARYHLTCEPKYVSFENTALETFFDGSR